MESLGFGLSLNEAKENIKTISKSLEPQLILNNLKKLLKFLITPALKVCFVNTQEDYLSFYHILVLDEAYLTSAFFTDECKVVAGEILKVLTANRDSFSWESCFGNRHIAGIPVILKKVFRIQNQHYKEYENYIDLEFKETWAKKTLKFVKSARPMYTYPNMKENEAEYVYEWILRQSREVDLGDEYLWTPVWEAMNIFRLRYEYVVSLHAIQSSSFKFVVFEKIKKKGFTNNEHIVQCKPKVADKERVNITDTNKVDPMLSSNHTEIDRATGNGQNKIEFVNTLPTSKKQRNKFEKKKKLVKNVSQIFIMKSFEKIYDFVNDDTRATLEMGNLTKNEIDMLVGFNYYTPTKVATSLIFDAPCNDLLVKIHLCLIEKTHFKFTASNGKKQKNDRTVIFRKNPRFIKNRRRPYTPDTEEDEYDSSEDVLDEMFDDLMEQLRIQGQKQTGSENAILEDIDNYEYEYENETFSTSSYEDMVAINIDKQWIGADIQLRNPLSILEKIKSTAERSTSVSPERSRVSTDRPWMPPERLWVSAGEGEIPQWDGKVQEKSCVAETLLASLINTARKNVNENEVQSDNTLRTTEPQTKPKEEKPNMKRKPLEVGTIQKNEAGRTPEPPSKEKAPSIEEVRHMKTKLIEGLSVPLESDKAMRMMRLMGWNGGALGLRGNGLIEPLNPILDLQKRVGLGHNMWKTQTVKQNKAQKKLKKENKKKKTKKLAKNKEKNKSASDLKGNETKDDVTSNNVKSGAPINLEGLESEKNKINNSKTAVKVTMSDEEHDNNTVHDTINLNGSEYDTCNVNHKATENTPITLTEDMLRTVEDEKLLDTACEPDADTATEVDEDFVHYKTEGAWPSNTVRMEFLVAVLDLVQSEKSFTFLWFSQKVNKSCEPHIHSMIKSFNERTKIIVADQREDVLLKAISEEMVAHSDMMLLIERDPFDRRVITIIKTTRGDNSKHLLIPQLDKFTYPPTHTILHYDNYGFAAAKKKVTTAHKIANRLLLYFVQSDYTEIACKFNFFMNNASRVYINAVISLLNRQVTDVKLGLGRTEYIIFKRIAAMMDDFFLIAKYDKTHMKFSQIKFVKVSISKGCGISQRKFNVSQKDNDMKPSKENKVDSNNINSSIEVVSAMDTSESFDDTAKSSNKENPTQCVDNTDIRASFDDTVIRLNQEYKNTFENIVNFKSSPKEMKNEKIGIENKDLVANPVSYSMDIVEINEPIDEKNMTNTLNEENKYTSINTVTIESFPNNIEDKISIENKGFVHCPTNNTAVMKVFESLGNTPMTFNEESNNTNKNTIIYESSQNDSRARDKIDIEEKNLVENTVQSMDVVEVHESFNDGINSLNEVHKELPKHAENEIGLENERVIRNPVETVNHGLNGKCTNKPKDGEDNTSIYSKNKVIEKSEHTEGIIEKVLEDNNDDKILQENCDHNIKMNEDIYDRINKYIEDFDKARSGFQETANLDASELNDYTVNSNGHILNVIDKETTKSNEDSHLNHNKNMPNNLQNIGSAIGVDNSLQNTMIIEDFSDKGQKVSENVPHNSNKNVNEVKDLTFDNNANHISFNINRTYLNDEPFETVGESNNKSNSADNYSDINTDIDQQEKAEDCNETNSSQETWPKKFIITLKHPLEMNNDSAAHIQTIIYKAVETINDTFLPSIECHGIKNEGIVYSFHNLNSFNWLRDQLSCYFNISEYTDDSNNTHLIEMTIKSFIKIDVDLVLKNIGIFYGRNTRSWKVIQERVFDKFCVIAIEIDNDSLEFIRKEQFSLFIGFDRAEIRLVSE